MCSNVYIVRVYNWYGTCVRTVYCLNYHSACDLRCNQSLISGYITVIGGELYCWYVQNDGGDAGNSAAVRNTVH